VQDLRRLLQVLFSQWVGWVIDPPIML